MVLYSMVYAAGHLRRPRFSEAYKRGRIKKRKKWFWRDKALLIRPGLIRPGLCSPKISTKNMNNDNNLNNDGIKRKSNDDNNNDDNNDDMVTTSQEILMFHGDF